MKKLTAPKNKKELVWHTSDEVFKKYRKSKEFRRGYREESVRAATNYSSDLY